METKAKTTKAKTTKTTKKLLTEKTTKTFDRTKYLDAKLAYVIADVRNNKIQYLFDTKTYTTMKKIKYDFALQVVQNLKPTTKKQLEDAMSLIVTIAEASNEELQKVANRANKPKE